MNNMNGYFNQSTFLGNAGGFAPQGGLMFNPISGAKATSSSPEELDTIRKSAGQNNFNFSAEDDAIASWDLREGTNLCIQLVDPSTDRVRIKYTNEEFNIVMIKDEAVQKLMLMLKDLIYTTKLINTNLPPEMSKELYRAGGIIMKLLPTAYSAGKKNYDNVMNQAKQQINAVVGYNGQWAANMFNGQFGAAPQYVINDNPNGFNNMQFNNGYVPQNQGGQMMDPNTIAQAAAIAAQMMSGNMGAPTQPNGGTMMGNGNPFVQGGQPQQVPQMNGMVPPPPQAPTVPFNPQAPTVPFPGQPIVPATPNPSIGQPVVQASTVI